MPVTATAAARVWHKSTVEAIACEALSWRAMTKGEAMDNSQFNAAHARHVRKSRANHSRAASATDIRVDAQTEDARLAAPTQLTSAASAAEARSRFRMLKDAISLRNRVVTTGIPNSSNNAFTVAARPNEASTIQAMVSVVLSRLANPVKRKALP